MNNKLKSFTVRRKKITYHETTIKARDVQDVWDRMDKHQLENEKEYVWRIATDESRAHVDCTYQIVD